MDSLDAEWTTPVQRYLQAFHDFHDQFRGAFPDINVKVEDVVAEGDKVVARCSVRGMHTGERVSGLQPPMRRLRFEGIAIVRIKNGKIVEAWNQFDFLAMNRQLGRAVVDSLQVQNRVAERSRIWICTALVAVRRICV